ncbi:hypothetical protein [Saccharopolyspora sp. 5N708]
MAVLTSRLGADDVAATVTTFATLTVAVTSPAATAETTVATRRA